MRTALLVSKETLNTLAQYRHQLAVLVGAFVAVGTQSLRNGLAIGVQSTPLPHSGSCTACGGCIGHARTGTPDHHRMRQVDCGRLIVVAPRGLLSTHLTTSPRQYRLSRPLTRTSKPERCLR